jgi:branched-chain amino acid transport system permease protein
MENFFNVIVSGVMTGGIYALVAIGWVLIYKCSGVLNLAMGELTLVGAFITISFYTMGVPFLAAIFISLVIGFILGLITERVFLDKLIGESILSTIMLTVGLSFFFKGIIQLIWGVDNYIFKPPVFSIDSISVGPILLKEVFLWSFIAAIILLIIFVSFFKYTRWGLAMQATADDEMAALSLGISARFVYSIAWAIAFMAAGVGGTLLGNISGVNISIAHMGLTVLPAVVLGGLNSVAGAIVGGIAIGIMESLVGTYVDSWLINTLGVPLSVKEIAPFLFMTIFLLFKPYGLWGWERIERV